MTDEADWWQRSLMRARLRRPMGLVGGAALLGSGCFFDDVRPDPPPQSQRAEDFDSTARALELQQSAGWDVGSDGALAFDGASPLDAEGTRAWRGELGDLYARLRPASDALLPYYTPTLFQSLSGARGAQLQAQISPIHTAAMDDDFARGLALRELFEQAGWPSDTAVVVDAPGARAVAVAAALADRFDPVFTFGNWPHPLGVVPAHETLASVLFYLPLFERARATRGAAPPLFVLDANRLAPYRDADGRFDNRYVAHLPTAAQLAALGIRHLLYVNADGQAELDDLNQAMVDLCSGGVDVKLLALSDFQRGAPPPVEVAALEEDDDDDAASFTVGWFWYGGAPEWQVTFWDDYGWYHCPHRIWVGPPKGRRGVQVGPPTSVRPAMARGFVHRPSVRPTLFVHAPPRGFGEIAVRVSRDDGFVTAVRPGGYRQLGGGAGAAVVGGGFSGRSGTPPSRAGFFSSGGSARSSSGGFSFGGRSGSFGRAGGGGTSS